MASQVVVEGGVTCKLFGAEEAVKRSIAGVYPHVSVQTDVPSKLFPAVRTREEFAVAVNLHVVRK